MTGKERCRVLKDVRKTLSQKLGIDLNQTECTYEGECKGTCPKCKKEESILNSALIKKGATLAGATLLTVSLTGCTLFEPDIAGDVVQLPENPPEAEELSGDVQTIEDDKTAPQELEGDMVLPENYQENTKNSDM